MTYMNQMKHLDYVKSKVFTEGQMMISVIYVCWQKIRSLKIKQKTFEMTYEVQSKIKLGMGHMLDNFEPGIGLAAGDKCKRVMIRDQCIFFAMNDQQGAVDESAILFVVEGLLEQSTGTLPIEVTCYFFNGNKGTQQHGRVNCIFLCDGESYCTADGSSKHDYLISSESVCLQKGHHSAGVCFDIGWGSFSFVYAVTAIFHGQYGILGFQVDHFQKLVGSSDVFSVGVEEQDKFLICAGNEEARNVLFAVNFVPQLQTALQTIILCQFFVSVGIKRILFHLLFVAIGQPLCKFIILAAQLTLEGLINCMIIAGGRSGDEHDPISNLIELVLFGSWKNEAVGLH